MTTNQKTLDAVGRMSQGYAENERKREAERKAAEQAKREKEEETK